MTDDLDERAAMSINLGRGTMGSSLVFGFVAGFFLNTLFKGNPLAYVYMIIIFGILYWLAYILMFIRSRGCEDDKATKQAKAERAAKVATLSTRTASLGLAYKTVFTSKNALCTLGAICFGYCWTFLTSGLMFYFFNLCIDSGALMGTFMSVRGLVTLLGGVFWVPLLLKLCKGSKKWCYIMSNVFSIIGMLLGFFIMRGNGMWYMVTCLIFGFFGSGATMMQVGLMGDCGATFSS